VAAADKAAECEQLAIRAKATAQKNPEDLQAQEEAKKTKEAAAEEAKIATIAKVKAEHLGTPTLTLTLTLIGRQIRWVRHALNGFGKTHLS